MTQARSTVLPADDGRRQPGRRRRLAAPASRQRSVHRRRGSADGSIEFLGRVDHQVKLRGHRIELGEIESALRECPSVEQSVAVVIEDELGQKRLTAYVVKKAQNTRLDMGELRVWLRERLPDDMVPAILIELDALPVSPNGKIDRKRLPKPAGDRTGLERDYVAPRNDVEAGLARIC